VNVLELIRLALARLAASRLRAALTMLGVIIGVASVIALVSVGQGATSGITSRLQGLGTNLLTVTPGANRTGATRGAAGSATTLTVDDANAIEAIDTVAAVSPELTTSGLVVAGAQNTTTTIIGTTPSFPQIRNYQIWVGSFLTDAAVSNDLRVAVLGATTADDLGLGARSIGSQITIDGLPFQLIGIFQPKGSAGIANQDDEVLIPISTLRQHFVGGDSVRAIDVSVKTADDMTLATAQLEQVLRGQHGLTGTATDDFTIQDQAQLLDTVSSITGTLTILLAGIASISLVVGGIGIMNIMLVSVRERTREIGIRKAVGAKRGQILLQFLVEAVTLSMLGGVVGIALGVAVSAAIAHAAGWALVIQPITIGMAVGFSALVGIVFGVWPARQAAVLDPIAALRYE
jgi:putative ABC transport system permease protein